MLMGTEREGGALPVPAPAATYPWERGLAPPPPAAGMGGVTMTQAIPLPPQGAQQRRRHNALLQLELHGQLVSAIGWGGGGRAGPREREAEGASQTCCRVEGPTPSSLPPRPLSRTPVTTQGVEGGLLHQVWRGARRLQGPGPAARPQGQRQVAVAVRVQKVKHAVTLTLQSRPWPPGSVRGGRRSPAVHAPCHRSGAQQPFRTGVGLWGPRRAALPAPTILQADPRPCVPRGDLSLTSDHPSVIWCRAEQGPRILGDPCSTH